APLPRLVRAAEDLAGRDDVGRPAQVLRELSLRERAEAAAEVADVRVVDVPRDDVADRVAVHLAAEAVGRGQHAVQLLAAGGEQADELLLAELCLGVDRQRVAWDEGRRRLRA